MDICENGCETTTSSYKTYRIQHLNWNVCPSCYNAIQNNEMTATPVLLEIYSRYLRLVKEQAVDSQGFVPLVTLLGDLRKTLARQSILYLLGGTDSLGVVELLALQDMIRTKTGHSFEVTSDLPRGRSSCRPLRLSDGRTLYLARFIPT